MRISPDELISNDHAAHELGLKPDTLTAWRARGCGPNFVKVGRSVRYSRADLADWLGAQRREPMKAASSAERI